MIRVQIQCNDEELDNIIKYNKVLDFIENDYQVDNNTFAVRRILDHEGPLNPKDHPENYKDSTFNVLVKWESKEHMWIPLKNIAYTSKAMCAGYAKSQNLLNTPGWTRFKG